MNKTYKSSGVSLRAGEITVKNIKKYAKSTFNNNVLSDIGLFGGFYKLDISKFKSPVLVSSVDGVGTKLKIAIEMNIHNTIGQDLVNHCVNDIAVCGAKPLFFLDYLAFGKLRPSVATDIVKGFAKACKENSCALIGGETAEMPGLYSVNEYDLSGTIVGVVDKSKIINGSKIKKGDLLIGFPSNGIHTNGYSLLRSIIQNKLDLSKKYKGFRNTLGKELLRVHKSYLNLIASLTKAVDINGMAHITGGGIFGNTIRIIPKSLSVKINWNSWEYPHIFRFLQEEGNVPDEEMRNVFNLGIGIVFVVSRKNIEKFFDAALAADENPIIIGSVV